MHIILPVFIFLFGLCVGSFLNVVVWRLPKGESLSFPGSCCPKCGEPVRWYDNFPILSWLLLKARCRFCNEPISYRYPVVELLTGLVVIGIYSCYFIFDIRSIVTGSIPPGEYYTFLDVFSISGPMFAIHCILACSLIACSLIDLDHWQVPLEICWLASLVGLIGATIFHTPEWLPTIDPETGAMAICATIGLIISNVLQYRGMIEPSFIDAPPPDKNDEGKCDSVAIAKTNEINPRVEILREVVFLSPAFIGALIAYLLVTYVPFIATNWTELLTSSNAAPYLNGFLASLFGYLIGGLWIWGARIFGTIGFGKEAMGLGDVHIMAAVGAVTGWIVPSIAFFVAPILGIAWAITLAFRKGQKEIPYGPWLSIASIVTLVFYDYFEEILLNYCRQFQQ